MQSAGGETVESTTDMGLKFLESLKQAKDKTYVHWRALLGEGKQD